MHLFDLLPLQLMVFVFVFIVAVCHYLVAFHLSNSPHLTVLSCRIFSHLFIVPPTVYFMKKRQQVAQPQRCDDAQMIKGLSNTYGLDNNVIQTQLETVNERVKIG